MNVCVCVSFFPRVAVLWALWWLGKFVVIVIAVVVAVVAFVFPLIVSLKRTSGMKRSSPWVIRH